jgi:nitrite reductase (NADH) small subunit
MPGQSWIEIGHLDDIPRRGARRIIRPRAAVPIAVFRAADDSVFALADRCPHKAGPLAEGIVQGCAVACPLHGWVIDLRSGRAEEPDEGNVPTVPVRLVEGRIFLSAPALKAVDAAVRRTQ